MLYDLIVIGNGPAGISASIYASLGNLNTLNISNKKSTLLWAGKIENYFGFPDGIDSKELFKRGIEQAKKFGTKFIDGEVVSIKKTDEGVLVKTEKSSYSAKTLLMATGHPPVKINLENISKFEGNGVAYCATCDGFFYNSLKVGVLGFKDFAVEEATELENFTDDITIFTNGKELELSDKYKDEIKRFKVDNRKIKKLDGNNALEKIVFTDKSNLDIDGIFIAYGSASSADFAKKMGILTKDDYISVDTNQMTNLDGIFAAGACTILSKGINQISTSVGQGAVSAKRILEYLGKNSKDTYNR